jgi:WD40 repeat protein
VTSNPRSCFLQPRTTVPRSLHRNPQIIKSAHNNVMTCCDVSDDGNTLLSCSNGFDGAGCELKVWDRRKGELLCDLRGHTQTVTGCAFLPASISPSPSSQSIISSSQDSTVRTWDYTQNRYRLSSPPLNLSLPLSGHQPLHSLHLDPAQGRSIHEWHGRLVDICTCTCFAYTLVTAFTRFCRISRFCLCQVV